MASNERRVSVRLPPDVRERVEAEACEKWNGNMSYTVLRALRSYFGMRQEEAPTLSAPIRFRAEAEGKRIIQDVRDGVAEFKRQMGMDADGVIGGDKGGGGCDV